MLEAPLKVVRRNFEFNLEALRGFAALIVVFSHILTPEFHPLDPRYSLSPYWYNFLPAHSSVLIFFVLSGYVIGLTNKVSLTRQNIFPYLRKRLIRLYPIYVISIIIILPIALRKDSLLTIIGNFFFLQVLAVPTVEGNGPLWSLNYEILYYLAFVPVSYLALSPAKVCIAAICTGILCTFILPFPQLSSYSFGFAFWVSGLWLSKSSQFPKQYSSRTLLIALLFIFMGFSYLNPLKTPLLFIQSKFMIPGNNLRGPGVLLSDLVELPFCLYLMLRFASQTIKTSSVIDALIVLSGFFYSIRMISKYGVESSVIHNLALPMVFFAIGVCLLLVTYTRRQATKYVSLPILFLRLGAISYAIYVIHMPITHAISNIKVFSGSAITFIIRLFVDIILIGLAGCLLELKLQHRIKALFDKKNAVV